MELIEMSNQDVLVKRHFKAFVLANATDRASLEALVSQRIGTYGHAVRAGIAAAGSVEAFTAGTDSLMDEIRTNAEGIAVKIGAQLATRATAEGGDVYRVPSAVSAAKSVVLAALRLGVPLVEKDGRTPVSYSSLRDAVIGPKSLTDRSPIDQHREAVRAGLRALLCKVRTMSERQLSDIEALFGIEDEHEAYATIVPQPKAAARRKPKA